MAMEEVNYKFDDNYPTKVISLREIAGYEDEDGDLLEERRAIKMPTGVPQKLCAPCHFSCLKCRGPNDYDCLACAPDSIYQEKSQNESHCLPFVQKSTINYRHRWLYVIFFIIVPAGLILICVCFLSLLLKKKMCDMTKVHYVYDRIDYEDRTDDGIVVSASSTDIADEQHLTIAESSSDEEDVAVFK